jgi:hypothetical protein
LTRRAAIQIGLIIALCLPGLTATSAAAIGPIAAPAFLGASVNGSRIFFKTVESLVPSDTDSAYDVYERFRGSTTLVSAGRVNGNGNFHVDFDGASANGRRVFFTTAEQLVPADTDRSGDVYGRWDDRTRLISAGRVNGNGTFDVDFDHVSADGLRVTFSTTERLVPADINFWPDVYQRFGGRTTLISTGPLVSQGFVALFAGASDDGRSVFFHTADSLVAGDADQSYDLYERRGGRTRLISAGQINGNGAFDAYGGPSADAGRRAFFSTYERLVRADRDDSADLYERFRGRTSLVSAGQINGNGDFDAGFRAASPDGRRVFFDTSERLVPADLDGAVDIYERSGGRTRLVSAGQINGDADADAVFFRASVDGSRVFFETTERLVPADTDSALDVYERFRGRTTLVSAGKINGNGNLDAILRGASADGRRVFFDTAERLAPADTDPAADIYARFRGRTRLVSAGQINGNGEYFPFFNGNTRDGRRAFFVTDEPLVSADTDADFDLYERSRGTTRLITAAVRARHR